MSIELPNLDDRRFQDLVQEAREMIAVHAPDWTNHNASDPGITLIELFAFLCDALIYRQNRVTDANVEAFLTLLSGPSWQSSGNLANDVRNEVLVLRRRERAVSCEDFEQLAIEADSRVGRAHCLPRRNLLINLEVEKAGHVSLIIVPMQDYELEIDNVIQVVSDGLEPRRLLTTFLHVVKPYYLSVRIQVTIVPLPDERLPDEGGADITQRVITAIETYFDPFDGGADENGWPFGRNVFVSEIYELLDKLPGVDYLQSVTLETVDLGRLITDDSGSKLIGVEVKPYELVDAQIAAADVIVNTA